MALPLPNLDNRTYSDLVAEAQGLLPSLDPEWTNYNPSDPGIVLVEMLAWLTEMLLYQVNEISDESVEGFLRLLKGDAAWSRPASVSLDEAVRSTILDLRERYRAVTGDDFVSLLSQTWPESKSDAELLALGVQPTVRLLGGIPERRALRVRCVPRLNLTSTTPEAAAAGHVSLVVVPEASSAAPSPTEALRTELLAFLEPRRTLTTQCHVVGPRYVPVLLRADLYLEADTLGESAVSVQSIATQKLLAFFDPLVGGPEGSGWPFGRSVYASEVYATLRTVGQVAWVEKVGLAAPTLPERVERKGGADVALTLQGWELVQAQSVTLGVYKVSKGITYQLGESNSWQQIS